MIVLYEKIKITMYMRQIMRSMVALMVLVSPAIPASATVAGGFEAGDSVKAEQAVLVSARTITGTVYDAATNTPLPGVRVQGTGHQRVTTMTDAEGKYKLNVPSYVTLLSFSTPEFLMVQRPVLKDDVINVRLYSDKFAKDYNEDIKITAGDDFTTAISPALSIDTDIQGKLGAQVRSITRSGTPGIGAFMLIRGINSLNANSQPLVIVDDVILDLQEDYGALHMGMFNNVLSAIDVNDIDNVEVLTNGTAIYGARAANGVIKITTKRGKSMATRITANIYANIALAPKLTDMMKAEQYRTYANELIGTMNTTKKNFEFLNSDPEYFYYNKYHNETDWADEVYREAFTQNYKVNVEGGDEVAMYNFSLGYTMGESTIDKNTFDRLNIRFNSDISLAKNLATRFDISYSRVARELLDDGIMENSGTDYPYSSPGFVAMVKSPFLSPYMYFRTGGLTSTYDEADTFAWGIDDNVNRNQDNNSLYNPLTIIHTGSGENKNDQEYTLFTLTVAPELTLGNFKITETFNYTLHRMSEKYYLPYAIDASKTQYHFYAQGLGKIGNFISSSFGKETNISSDTRVSWSKIAGAHNMNIFGGFRYTRFAFDSNFLSCANSGNDKATSISQDYDYLKDSGDDNVWTNLAWYLNADYSYKTRYFLQAALSLETSSRFGKEADGLSMGGVQWGVFPSVQAAWLISSEPWFNVKPINSLKLRAGYDITGNDAIDFYACRSFMQAVKFQNTFMGIQLGNVENEGVQWETTSRLNVGVDGMFFDNRLGVSFDWYMAKTSDLLVPKKYDYVTGMDTYWSNGGELENMGFEATVNAKLINTRNFQWELGVSAGHYKNEITSLDQVAKTTNVYGAEVLTQVGEAIGTFYGYKTDGVISSVAEADELGLYQVDATGNKTYFQAGDVKFVDMNGDKIIDSADKTVIGNPNPDLYGNIFTRFTYKDWTLNVAMNYSLGNDVYNYYRSQLEGGKNFFNQSTAMLNRWTVDGQTTDMPRAVYGDPMGNARFSDRWIEDGSYLRLKTVQLSYNVPVNFNWLQGVTVWCAAENLLTLTKYLGNDPEFSVNNNVLYQGIDAGLLPQSRSFHLGVKVNL